MLKFVLLAIVLTVANGQLMGGWKPIDTNGLPDTVEKIARWSLAAMNQKLITSGSEGFHAQMIGIKDVFSQVVAGTNYKFSMDTIYSESSKYTGKTCDISVFVPLGNQDLRFNSEPVCKDNNMFGPLP